LDYCGEALMILRYAGLKNKDKKEKVRRFGDVAD
jgi:hypothetical protein